MPIPFVWDSTLILVWPGLHLTVSYNSQRLIKTFSYTFLLLFQETSTTTSNQTVAENKAAGTVDETQASGDTANDVPQVANDVPQAANGDGDVEMSTESSSVDVDVAVAPPNQEALVQSA